ncbi:ribulose-phosphate 3-epimerase [Christensenellaceae bacterium]|nr:ribulose-phosphate 3-epimerase [Christensenellaceae bacterium]BDF59892.1 ribulose-phosphate 3-epimerase [Christensenellaceae bacterium]
MSILSTSILGCNAMFLGENVEAVKKAGTDFVHVDIMDGVYVKNIAFGPKTVSDIKSFSDTKVEVHLELHNPENYVEMFDQAGADALVFQLGTTTNPIRLLKEIHARGMMAGIALNPADPWENLKHLTDYADYIIMMSVEPGFGNQVFEESVYQKVRELKEFLTANGRKIPIGVDGSVNLERAQKLKTLGADWFIVGSAIFSSGSREDQVAKFRTIIG